MTESQRAARHGTRARGYPAAALAAASVVVAGGLLAWLSAKSEPLGATNNMRWDFDGDGLPNLLELGSMISPDHFDSDGDTFGDGEEFARGSSPSKGSSVPVDDDVSVGFGAYMQGAELRGLAATYVPDGLVHSVSMAVGFSAGNRPRLLPAGVYLSGMKVFEQTVGNGPAKAVYFDLPLSLAALQSAPDGRMAIFVILYHGNHAASAATIHLTYRNGAVLELVNLSAPAASIPGEIVPVLQRPLGGSYIPDGWVPGSLCFQEVEVVGYVGPLIKEEVVAAGCQDGWDGFCDPIGCEASVGSTLAVLDPGVLIGG